MTILKLDVDIPQLKKDKKLFEEFIETRMFIIEKIGYTLKSVTWKETNKGFHFWIEIKEKLTEEEVCNLQFLLGDDQARCRFNYLRLEANCFNQFNVLFNRKFKP